MTHSRPLHTGDHGCEGDLKKYAGSLLSVAALLAEPIGNIPPAEAEERYYAMLDVSGLDDVAMVGQTIELRYA
jgi:hypothetical protein